MIFLSIPGSWCAEEASSESMPLELKYISYEILLMAIFDTILITMTSVALQMSPSGFFAVMATGILAYTIAVVWMKILCVDAGAGAVGGEACDVPGRSPEAGQMWSRRYVRLSADGPCPGRKPSFHSVQLQFAHCDA